MNKLEEDKEILNIKNKLEESYSLILNWLSQKDDDSSIPSKEYDKIVLSSCEIERSIQYLNEYGNGHY